MLWDLLFVIGGPCKRYAVTLTRVDLFQDQVQVLLQNSLKFVFSDTNVYPSYIHILRILTEASKPCCVRASQHLAICISRSFSGVCTCLGMMLIMISIHATSVPTFMSQLGLAADSPSGACALSCACVHACDLSYHASSIMPLAF